jgi:glycerophosphoryl diester phosphodiesterase
VAIFHLKWPRWKHEENSIRGIRTAARRGYSWIDLDLQMTKDGVIVVTHWARPMRKDRFRDPRSLIDPDTSVRHLTWDQLRRLRTTDGYRIPRIEAALRACHRYGIGAYLEPKGDPRFGHDEPWQHIAKVADDVGTHVRVRALRANQNALIPAHRVGFRTNVIPR